jgi:predicted Zn-dependent peptidase
MATQVNEITTHTLHNGLRMVHVTSNSPVAWCGVAVNAGSRDEIEGQYGLAHFVEHTIFKGTTHRRAWHILNRMETVGGELNAYTTKEGTMLYSVFPSQYMERAVELLADLVENSIFPEKELEKELEVVLEEVASYRDTPSDAVYDDFEDMLFADSPLGHNILGIEDDLHKLTSTDCKHYLQTLYAPQNMVFFAVGNTPSNKVFRLAEKYLGILDRTQQRPERTVPVTNTPCRKVVDMGLHQSHTIVGARTPSMYDDRRFALSLLNNMLGGPGMNSLLNVQLREKRGYVYTVESSISTMTDCGMMEIYFGCENDKVKKSLNLIGRTLSELASTRISEYQLEAYKKQYCGQLVVAADNAESTAMNAGKSMLYFNHVSTLNEIIDRIKAVTADDVRDAAQLLTLNNCSILTFK